jgi:glycosyltransferase involved in cell wall biosynthesis
MQHWRTPVFRRLAQWPGIEFRAFYGADFPGTKTVSGKDLSGFDHHRMATIKVRLPYEGEAIGLPICPALPWNLARYWPDVILAEGANNINNAMVYAYAALTRTPVVWWTLGELRKHEQMSLKMRAWRTLHWALERRSTALLGYSSLALQYFDSMGYPREMQFRAVNCVDTDRVLARLEGARAAVPELRTRLGLDGCRVLLFVGALTPVKRLEDLLLAYRTLRARFPDLRVLIVGDGPHRRPLEEFAAAQGVGDGVVFAGEQIETVSSYFLLGDIFVLPGLGGLGISEAMAHSLPVVVTKADGCELDLVETGRNGYIVGVGDVAGLTSALGGMLADRELLAGMGAHSRWIIDNKYNINTYMANVVAALEYAYHKSRGERAPARPAICELPA